MLGIHSAPHQVSIHELMYRHLYQTCSTLHMLNCGNAMQLGISSVREHMDSLVSKAEKFNKHKQELQSQGSKLRQALAYERSSDASKKLQKLEKQEAAGRQARQDQEADLEQRVCALIYNDVHVCVHGRLQPQQCVAGCL